ncbi:hypothetical protein OUZ56_005464 [Daphnia magna]|uniref:Uncharacterized protein n=1 Tax=Daphnia magna TaxID=35525 RepID=A0ABQ9YSU9_9CRUS|nr:hypothetical protein OUZ56_005464 [Daphnia magna]
MKHSRAFRAARSSSALIQYPRQLLYGEKDHFEILDHPRNVLHSLSLPAAMPLGGEGRMAKWIFLDDGVTAINDVTGKVYKFKPSINYNGQGQAPQNATDESSNLKAKQEKPFTINTEKSVTSDPAKK